MHAIQVTAASLGMINDEYVSWARGLSLWMKKCERDISMTYLAVIYLSSVFSNNVLLIAGLQVTFFCFALCGKRYCGISFNDDEFCCLGLHLHETNVGSSVAWTDMEVQR